MIDETHDPSLRSWVKSANVPGAGFPIQNLPFGVFRREGEPHIGVAIGSDVLDLHVCASAGLVNPICRAGVLNPLMALDAHARRALRRSLSAILNTDATERPPEPALVPQASCEMLVPANIGDYTDFYASIFHATNVGRLFRPDNPLLSNYKWIPIAYHGRASSIVISGTAVRRPSGQTQTGDSSPEFGPSRSLDFEMELGFFTGPGNELGAPIPIDRAHEHFFGVCLVNDWSARDVQRWEYQPLGPFLAKSFATSISPWVVTMEALAPFRTAAYVRAEGDPAPLPYLFSEGDQAAGAIDASLEVWLRTAAMRAAQMPPTRVSGAKFAQMYWTPAQMLTHHTSNGCNLRPGDLLASGTVSSGGLNEAGCLLELTAGGKQPVALPNGESRRFLDDGDEVIFRGYCERPPFASISLGECSGIVQP